MRESCSEGEVEVGAAALLWLRAEDALADLFGSGKRERKRQKTDMEGHRRAGTYLIERGDAFYVVGL